MPSRPASPNVPAARSGPRGNRRRAGAALIALLAVLSGAVVSTAAAAQEDNTAGDSTTVRIVARKLESGRIEFGLQQRQPDNTWGDRQLPRVRFFPTTATVGSWLASSSLDLPAGEVRIVARKLESGRIEFGLQQRQPDNTWGDRQLPRVRFFPTTATAGNWLASSTLTLTTPQPAPQPGGNPPAGTPPSPPATAIRAGCAPTAPSPAGATTTTGRRPRRPGSTPPSPPGSVHSCGLRTDGTITCWGRNNFGEATAPAGQYSAVTAGGVAFVRPAHQRHHHLLGLQRRRAGDRARPGSTPPSPPACCIRAGCAPTAPSPAGATTPTGRRPRRPGSTPPSPPARHSCGLRTNGTITCWDTNGNGLGRQLPRAGDRARRAVLRRHRRRVPYVWAAHQRHHHLLGHQRQRAGDRARWAVLRRHRRHLPFVWAAHRRHHHLLGPQRTAPEGQYSADRRAGRAPSPAGTPPSRARVTAGIHSCGLRTNGTITCWGTNSHGQATAPDGQYSAVTAGDWPFVRAAHQRHHHLLGPPTA